MSIENASIFINKITTDADFVSQISKAVGHEFTLDEIMRVLAGEGDLNDAQLDKVVGGSGSIWGRI